MKEPDLINPAGERVPFSKVPCQVLRMLDYIETVHGKCGDPDQSDHDFMRRYAAWLLSERGTIG